MNWLTRLKALALDWLQRDALKQMGEPPGSVAYLLDDTPPPDPLRYRPCELDGDSE